MNLIKRLILVLLSIFCLCQTAQGQESEGRRILVLNSYHKGYPWTDNIVKGLESALNPSENGFDFIVEYMDSKAIVYDTAYKKMLYDLYTHKYANQTFDVIISTDDNALNFLREYHGELFPHVPVVFCGVNNTKVPDLVDRNIFTGIMEIWAAKENVKLILALHPHTRQIVVINGNTPSEEYQWSKLEPIFSEFDNIDFKRLDNAFSMVEIKDYLRRLPEESVVLYSAIFRDKTGTYYGHQNALERISKVNSRPIYGLHAQALPHGIVGGKLLAGYHEGQEAGRMTFMLLDGQKPSEIPIVEKDNNQYMFDYVELKRWHIDLSDLPEGSIIVKEPASIFREHKSTVLLSLLVFIILFILIMLLTFNIRRRKRSERSLKKSRDGLEIEVINRTSALRKSNEDLTVEIAEREKTESALRNTTHDLGERMKELKCLYSISELIVREGIALDEILQGTAELIPPSWQYPEVTSANVIINGQEFRTRNFKETVWEQSANIFLLNEKIGILKVCYLEKRPDRDEGPFSKEERNLINAIAKQLGGAIERIKADSLLKENEAKYKALFENAQVALFRTNISDGKLFEINERYAKLAGYSTIKNCLEGFNAADAWADSTDRDQLLRLIKEKNSVTDYETTITQKNGTHKNIIFSATIYPDQGFIEGSIVDITDSTLAKKALARQNDINFALAEISSAIISITTIDEVCELVLKHAKELTGSQFGYVGYIDPATGFLNCPTMTKEVWEKCQIDHKKAIFKNFNSLLGWVLTEGRPLICNDPANDSRSKGTPEGHIPIDQFLSVPAILQEKVVGQIALANPGRDYIEDDLQLLTKLAPILATAIQRRQIEDALHMAKKEAETANRAKSDFLASISHELRTPLNAVLGFAQVISKDKNLPARHGDHVAMIRQSGDILLALINQILDLSKIESGKMSVVEASFNLHDILDELNKMFRLLSKQKRLLLTIECAKKIPRNIVTDELKLRQVLINLINNALKFTKKGSVSLVVKSPEGSIDNKSSSPDHPVLLQFEIKDTGPGIAPGEIDMLFNPFTQAEEGKKSHKGTGLGLSISKKFVELLGGEITVKSQLDKGTTFSFTIPVKEAHLSGENQTRTKTIMSNPALANSLDILKTELKSLSRPLIHKLEEAATYCEVDDIHQIIQQIESPHPDLAGELEHLVKEFDFDGILALIKETR